MEDSDNYFQELTILIYEIFFVTFRTEELHLIWYITENWAKRFAIVNPADCFTKKL